MKTLLALLLLSTSTFAKTHIISHDLGGGIDTYVGRYDRWAANGDSVIIDGMCWSACTYVLRVPNVCATQGSVLAFHEAYYLRDGNMVRTNKLRSRAIMLYPLHVRKELFKRGGYGPKWIYIWATDILPECKG